MSGKKLDKKEKEIAQKRETVRTKLMFASLIVVLVVATNIFISQSRTEADEILDDLSRPNKSADEILGVSTDEERQLYKDVREQAQSVADTVSSRSEKLVTDSKARIENTVNDLIYTSTIKPLIDRIDRLPEEQKDFVQDAICPAPQKDPQEAPQNREESNANSESNSENDSNSEANPGP